jgi:hypothetical protein
VSGLVKILVLIGSPYKLNSNSSKSIYQGEEQIIDEVIMMD